MSKKRAKSGTASAGAARWESGLLATPFEEDGWTSFVGAVVPDQLLDKEYAAFLCSCISAKQRKLYTLVTYQGLIEEVQELGNPKGKKPKDVPAFAEICETAKVHLDSGEPIPLPLLAKLVKWKLLAIKQEDQKRRETDQKETSGKESKEKKSGKKSARGKSAKGKGKKTPEVPSPKKESTLKKRGEEDEENKYIDDEPDDGPQHYTLLYGFLDAPLLVLLSDLGINVNCILRFTCEDYSLFQKRKAIKEEEEEEDFQKPPEVMEAEQKAEAKSREELEKFWKQYEPLLKRALKGSSLHDIARITYSVKNDMVPEEYEDAENQIEFGTALFEDIACVIYDLLDKNRQFQNYKTNMKLVQINAGMAQTEPQLTTSSTTAPLAGGASSSAVQIGGEGDPQSPTIPGQVDIRYYSDLMDCIPAESCSVPLIMHCMLEQVVVTEEAKDPPSAKLTQPRADGLDHILAAQIDNICEKFSLKETDKPNGHSSNTDTENHQQFPVFYHHGDKSSERLRHLVNVDGFDSLNAELSMLKLLPVSMVTKFPRPSESVIKQRSARLHELLFQCFKEGTDTAEMDQTLRKFVFESLILRSTDGNGRVQRDSADQEILWDDPYIIGNKRKEPPSLIAGEQMRSPGGEMSLPPDVIRSTTPGILKVESKSRQGSAGSVRSSKSQVHFEDGVQTQKDPHEAREVESNVSVPDKKLSPTPSLISVQDVADQPQRNLDEWCFVEHLKPNVLLQVLDEARTLCPFIDTYYHRKDHSLLIVMHNPTDSQRKNIISWDAKLHSDVGFRNYLEHVADYIDDWTDKEEQKYQMEMRERELAAELAAAQAAAAASSAAITPSASRPGSSKGRTRSQSPKKSRSKSPKGRSSESPAPAANLDPNSGGFMRPNSMKSWKVEHDRLVAEEEKKKQDKDKKGGRKSARSRSSSPKKEDKEEKGKDKKDEGKKRGASGRGSRKGDKEKKEPAENEIKDDAEVEQPPEPERYYPFVGYDVGNNMIHANGTLTSMFPTEGGLVCCEKTEFINGDLFVKTTVLKDGHALTVHILDPKDLVEDEENRDKPSPNDQEVDATGSAGEKQVIPPTEEAVQKPLSRFGSLTASLNDGMVLSLSSYGKYGANPQVTEEKPLEEIEIPPVASPSPPPPTSSPTGGRGGSGKKGKKGAPAMSVVAESEKASQKISEPPKEEETKPPEPAPAEELKQPPYQQLFISCPNGLHVSYMLESMAGVKPLSEDDPGKMLIKQSYPSKTSGRQPCEAPIQNPAMGEKCRYITKEGAVIKLMLDGNTEVLFPTGAVSRGYPSQVMDGPASPTQSRDASPQRDGSSMSNHLGEGKKGNMKTSGSKAGIAGGVDSLNGDAGVGDGITPFEWVTTTVSGDRVSTKTGDSPLQEGAVMLYLATDPVTEEVMTTREDKVIIVERPDGTRIVDHSDGTRITSYAVNLEYRESNGQEEETGEMAPVKVRSLPQVKVECVGYATVIFNCEDSIATTIFGNGTQVIAIPDGSYEVLHHDGTRMTVGADGCVSLIPRTTEGDNGASHTPAVFILQHKEKIICDVREPGGNSFSINWKGEVMSEVKNETENKGEDGEKETAEESGQGDGGQTEAESKDITKREAAQGSTSHVPRFFVIHADGSGFELLREQDVRNYFQQVQMDPTTAFIQDPLADHPDIQGLTVMRPYLGNICDTWRLKPDEANIVPPNLRPRDFSGLPSKESKKPGPKFGTNVGRGLAIGSREDPPQPTPAPRCPRFLQLRQFTQYKPLDAEMRREMRDCLDRHAKEVEEQARVDSERELKDPRSEEEKILAGDLLAQILAQDENQDTVTADGGNEDNVTSDKQTSTTADKDISAAKPTDVEGDPKISKGLYESATAPPPLPPPPKPHNKYTEDDWERVRLELKEEEENRAALRKGEVPPYFESQWGKSFLAAQSASSLSNPDMELLSKKLAEGSKQGTQPPSNSLPSTPGNTPAPTQGGGDVGSIVIEDIDSPNGQPTKVSSLLTTREEVSPLIQGLTASPSDVRPTNPTPGHADGVGTPTQVRPTNPTPAHASQAQPINRPGNPTPSTECDVPSQNLPSDTPSSYASFPNHPSTIPEQVEEREEGDGGDIQGENILSNSEETLPAMPSSETLMDIEKDHQQQNGEAESLNTSSSRRVQIRLPAAIQGQKPGALPNRQFQAVEEPVRRKVMTSSLAGRTTVGDPKISTNRGFELVPGEVFFGELREGCTYAMVIHLKNIGIDSCRYKVKQPPPATGLQVIYKPGPVAAGMKAELQIQLYAIAVGVEGESGRGSIGHHVEITTETDFIFLPVSAYILTAHEYDEQCRTKGRPYLTPGAHLLSNRPPSREGIIRPRKEQNLKGNLTQTATR